MSEHFITTLINSRKSVVQVFEHTGEQLFTLPPGADCSLETDDSTATFARWSKVEFTDEEPFAKLTPREGFKEPPKGPWSTEFLCLQGDHDPEYRTVSPTETICLMRGIPVFVGQEIVDPYITVVRVVIRPVMKERPADPPFQKYATWETVYEDQVTLRSERELEAIQAALDEIKAKEVAPAPKPKRKPPTEVDDKPVGKVGPVIEVDLKQLRDQGGWMPDLTIKPGGQL